MVFLSFCCLDFIFHGLMGIFDYTDLFMHNDKIVPDMPTNHSLASMSVACFCVLALVVVLPVWYVQATNIIRNTTTHERFGYNGVKANDKDSKNTDTQSMLIGDSSEWTIVPINQEQKKKRCCWGKSQKSIVNIRVNSSKPSVM